MRIPVFVLPIGAAMLLWSVPLEAHHSFSGTYDVSKEITIKGKIVEISFRSPHSLFFVEAPDADGNTRRWAIEAASAAQFAQQGVSRNVFRIGDPVEIVANPVRSATGASYRGRMLKITRTTDGKSWGASAGDTVQ